MAGPRLQWLRLSVQLNATRSRDVTGLCQPEETGLQLRVWVTLAPSLPPRRTLVSLPKVVLQVNCADKRTSGLVPSWPLQGPCDLGIGAVRLERLPHL